MGLDSTLEGWSEEAQRGAGGEQELVEDLPGLDEVDERWTGLLRSLNFHGSGSHVDSNEDGGGRRKREGEARFRSAAFSRLA